MRRLALAGVLATTACGSLLATRSAEVLPCPAEAIAIVDPSVAGGTQTWMADCDGRRYACASLLETRRYEAGRGLVRRTRCTEEVPLPAADPGPPPGAVALREAQAALAGGDYTGAVRLGREALAEGAPIQESRFVIAVGRCGIGDRDGAREQWTRLLGALSDKAKRACRDLGVALP